MRETEYETKLDREQIDCYGLGESCGDNYDVEASATVTWEFYISSRTWGIKNMSAYATKVKANIKVNIWQENGKDDEPQIFHIDTSDEEWKHCIIDTDTSAIEFGDDIRPWRLEVDFQEQTLTIYF